MQYTGPIDKVWAEYRLRYLRGDEMWETLIEKRQAFSEQETDRKLLTESFSQLRTHLSRPIEIRIVDRLTSCETPYGMTRVEQLSGKVLEDDDHEGKFIPFVLGNLERSGLEVDSFAICFLGSYANFISTIVGAYRKMDVKSKAFCHLKKLHLKFEHGKDTPTDAVNDNFCDFIGSFPEVEDLVINVQFHAFGSWGPVSTSRLVNGLCGVLPKLPRLRHLEIQDYDIPTETLLNILPHIKALETFHYHTCSGNHPRFQEEVARVPKLARGNRRSTRTQADLEAFRARCGCLSFKIAECTLLEWAYKKHC